MARSNKNLPPEDPVFWSLIRALGSIKRVVEPMFHRHGISPSQWAVLRTLQQAELEGLKNLRQTDLGNRMLIRPPSVTGAIDRLVRAGFVTRTTSPDDQRANLISLSPTGREMAVRAGEAHAAKIDELLAGLKRSERAELRRLLDRLADHAATFDTGPEPSQFPDDCKE